MLKLPRNLAQWNNKSKKPLLHTVQYMSLDTHTFRSIYGRIHKAIGNIVGRLLRKTSPWTCSASMTMQLGHYYAKQWDNYTSKTIVQCWANEKKKKKKHKRALSCTLEALSASTSMQLPRFCTVRPAYITLREKLKRQHIIKTYN